MAIFIALLNSQYGYFAFTGATSMIISINHLYKKESPQVHLFCERIFLPQWLY
uniref:AA_permease domain-containing protein n=1 Tax=Brugia timori TaxID=42155 RepID=A0A0R3QNM7_9BILA